MIRGVVVLPGVATGVAKRLPGLKTALYVMVLPRLTTTFLLIRRYACTVYRSSRLAKYSPYVKEMSSVICYIPGNERLARHHIPARPP